MLIRSTAHPSYCPSAKLHIRPTATSDLRQLFNFVLFEGQVRLCQVKTISGASAAARTGQRAERRGQDRLVGRALRPEVQYSSCKTTCQQVGWAVGRMGVGPKIHHRENGINSFECWKSETANLRQCLKIGIGYENCPLILLTNFKNKF